MMPGKSHESSGGTNVTRQKCPTLEGMLRDWCFCAIVSHRKDSPWVVAFKCVPTRGFGTMVILSLVGGGNKKR